MSALATLLLVLLAVAPPSMACRSLGEATEVLQSPHRSLLQAAPLGVVAASPPACFQAGNCQPVSVPPIVVCPAGTTPVPSAAAPTTCLMPCPTGSQPMTDAAGNYWCAPQCPAGFQASHISGSFLICVKCGDNCEYNRVQKKCVNKCAAPLPVPYNTPAPNGACCSAKCPDPYTTLVSFPASGSPVTCSASDGKVRVFDNITCRARKECQTSFAEVQLLPRKKTPPNKQCPPKPPVVLTLLSGGQLKDCIKCRCADASVVSYPYLAADGSVKCSASKCPTGYTLCGPLCVRDALATLLGGTPFDPLRCWEAASAFDSCIKPCSDVVIQPNPAK